MRKPVLEKYVLTPYIEPTHLDLHTSLRVCTHITLENEPGIQVNVMEVHNQWTSFTCLGRHFWWPATFEGKWNARYHTVLILIIRTVCEMHVAVWSSYINGTVTQTESCFRGSG